MRNEKQRACGRVGTIEIKTSSVKTNVQAAGKATTTEQRGYCTVTERIRTLLFAVVGGGDASCGLEHVSCRRVDELNRLQALKALGQVRLHRTGILGLRKDLASEQQQVASTSKRLA